MTHRPFKPPMARKAHKVPHERHVVCGPVFLLPALLRTRVGVDSTGPLLRIAPRDPRMCVAGRWVPYLRASHRLYVRRIDRQLSPPVGARVKKLWRIAHFVNADRAIPF